MAIKIYDDYYTIIVKVESIIRIYGDKGLELFLKDFFPQPFKKKNNKKFLSLFFKSKKKEENILDDYFSMHHAERFNCITGVYGHDGNLAFMSFSHKEDFLACCEHLEQKGFYGYESVIYVEDVDYVISNKNGFPISVMWLETIEKNKNSAYTASPTHVYSTSPFKQPIRPTSFPNSQGGLSYETELQWNLSQKYIQNKEFICFSEVQDISIIYTNCRLSYHFPENIDEWLKSYDAKIDLTRLSGNIEYKLLTIIGNCIHSCNFIPLYHFLDEEPIVRLDKNKAEQPIFRDRLIVNLTGMYLPSKNTDIKYSIQFQPQKNKYIGCIERQGIKEIVNIEVRQNKIYTLWIVEKSFYILSKENFQILNQIAEEWNQGNPLYIERYLAENFKYTLYGKEEIFGNHILSKRQYIIYWDSAYEIMKKAGIIYKAYYTSATTNGIACYSKESAMFIKMHIENGLIISAEAVDIP